MKTKLINRLLDGFIGNLTTTKWAKICKCSQDTAHRDIKELISLGIVKKSEEGGKNTSYKMLPSVRTHTNVSLPL